MHVKVNKPGLEEGGQKYHALALHISRYKEGTEKYLTIDYTNMSVAIQRSFAGREERNNGN